jgi:hypothetical protein
MLSKCANPSCSTTLVYLREGKVFMVESPQTENAADPQGYKPKTVRRVEHFWLCGPCSANLTLARDGQHGVKIVPKKVHVLAAAS